MNVMHKIEELRMEEKVIQDIVTKIDLNKGFVYEIEVTKQAKKDTKPGQYVTNCLLCNFTCHIQCVFEKDEDKCKCSAMDQISGLCKNCVEHCHWTSHVNNPYYFVLYKKTETRTSEDLRTRYETACAGKSATETMVINLKSDIQRLELQAQTMIREAHA